MVREYTRVSDETRRRLINYIKAGRTIKEAAELVNINYENAKAINRIYKHETRVDKKKSRFRYRNDEDRNETKRKRDEFQKNINGLAKSVDVDSSSLYESSEISEEDDMSSSQGDRPQSIAQSTRAVAEQLSTKTKTYLELVFK
jgi:hypothetical protein